ncbi:MAG TPA: T9SS type A sorting domain-containing protein [Flavipsychrobacter sp.]|nr:T9SS type A sorting domain-containing protein [Flavipsychrobacter sp.]
MKHSLLLFVVINLFVAGSYAQTTYSYNFNGNLHESSGVGPDLISACSGSYTMTALPGGVTKDVYSFGSGCGITFNDAANFLSSGSYTIEMLVELDTVQGYKKLIDYNHRSSDNGFYNQSGTVVLYPNFNADSVSLYDSQYEYIAISRDATTGNMFIFVNNVNQGGYADTANDYVYDSVKTLVFFEDDSETNHEETSGNVAMIHISNYAMDTSSIKNDYTNLETTLNIQKTVAHSSQINIYPNPAQNYINVASPDEYSYHISDITGKVLQNGSLIKGNATISISGLQPGMYFITMTNADTETQTYKIIKQ